MAQFWTWWREYGAAALAAAISTGRFDDQLVSELSGLLQAVHPDLAWELQPGTGARHRLCVTSGGAAELRSLARRWRRAAPTATEVWEYASSRPADPNATTVTLQWKQRTVAIADTRLRVEVDDEHWWIHLGIFHPAFADLTAEDAGQVGFLILDTLIGEDAVECWVGEVSTLVHEPGNTIAPDELEALIARLEARPRGEWVLLEGRSPADERVVAAARRPLRWLEHWPLDLHHAVTITFPDCRPDGLPDTDSLAKLRRLEDELTDSLGARGSVVAHETIAGQRLLHLYTDSEDQNGADSIARWMSRQTPDGWRIDTTSHHDPTWRHVRHLD